MTDAIKKYLEQWAEPEIALSPLVEGSYERALVVPACRETPGLLERFVGAADTSRGRTLCVLVVSAPSDSAPTAEDEAFLPAVVGTLSRCRRISESPPAWLGVRGSGGLSVLVIDRASPGFGLPPKEGVGLARKVGTDLALALHASGQVASRFIFGTDAGATLPDAWFDQPGLDDHAGLAAVVMPFWHEPARDPAVTRAVALYELALRYQVAGLAWAGAPCAFHTLGSVTAVSAAAYASVRGYPKRAADEDFYLLNKIAKVGAVACPPGLPVRIESRVSAGIPFGAGAGVDRQLVGSEPAFLAPECFALLRAVLGHLDAFAEHGEVARLRADVDGIRHPSASVASRALAEPDALSALDAAAREAPDAAARRLRVAAFFDAVRTLKLLHAARDEATPSRPWRDALAAAPFGPRPRDSGDSGLVAIRTAYALHEARFPMFRGPWAARGGPGGRRKASRLSQTPGSPVDR